MAFSSMALCSHDDKRRTAPTTGASQVCISSKKVPALTQGFEWAYVPGVELYSVLEQG